MDIVNTAMNNLKLSPDLRREVTEFFITTHDTSCLQKELTDFMLNEISETYKVICSIQIFKTPI